MLDLRYRKTEFNIKEDNSAALCTAVYLIPLSGKGPQIIKIPKKAMRITKKTKKKRVGLPFL